MKTKGFVGIIALVAVCSLLQAPIWAQVPGSGERFADEGIGSPNTAFYQFSSEPVPEPIAAGSVFISDDPLCCEEGLYSSPGGFGLGSFTDVFGIASSGRKGFFAGGAVLALEADFDSSTAFFIEDQTGSSTITTNQDFDYKKEGAPRVWLGWQDDWGLAFRVTWFEFEDRRKQSAVAAANFIFLNGLPTPTVQGGLLAGGSAGDTIAAKSSIEYYTIDAEITQELNFQNWQTTFGGGFRHAAINQRYSAVGTASGVPLSSTVQHRFDGEGPTAFAEFRIPVLGTKDRRFIGSANLSVYGHVRGAILFGNAKIGAVDITPGPTVDTALLRNHDSLATGEIRIGIQLDVRPVDGRLIFVRGGWEAQWLDGVGNVSNLSADRDLVLEGYSISGGIDW